jgi:hypothetical protein
MNLAANMHETKAIVLVEKMEKMGQAPMKLTQAQKKQIMVTKGKELERLSKRLSRGKPKGFTDKEHVVDNIKARNAEIEKNKLSPEAQERRD